MIPEDTCTKSLLVSVEHDTESHIANTGSHRVTEGHTQTLKVTQSHIES